MALCTVLIKISKFCEIAHSLTMGWEASVVSGGGGGQLFLYFSRWDGKRILTFL